MSGPVRRLRDKQQPQSTIYIYSTVLYSSYNAITLLIGDPSPTCAFNPQKRLRIDRFPLPARPARFAPSSAPRLAPSAPKRIARTRHFREDDADGSPKP